MLQWHTKAQVSSALIQTSRSHSLSIWTHQASRAPVVRSILCWWAVTRPPLKLIRAVTKSSKRKEARATPLSRSSFLWWASKLWWVWPQMLQRSNRFRNQTCSHLDRNEPQCNLRCYLPSRQFLCQSLLSHLITQSLWWLQKWDMAQLRARQSRMCSARVVTSLCPNKS